MKITSKKKKIYEIERMLESKGIFAKRSNPLPPKKHKHPITGGLITLKAHTNLKNQRLPDTSTDKQRYIKITGKGLERVEIKFLLNFLRKKFGRIYTTFNEERKDGKYRNYR